MTGSIGQYEPASRRLKEPISNVDRYALLSFRLQSIYQQRVIHTAFHGTKANRVALESDHYVVGNGTALEQQPSNQCGLAVIDAAAGEDAQKRLRHQK